MTVPSGCLTGIIGPNGAGKTTLLRCLAGELPLVAGGVLLNHQSLAALNARERARLLAYLPQTTPFAFAYTTMELVGLQVASARSLHDALETLELHPLVTRSLLSLSGGERQRAAIGRVLAQSPPILLLDEPLTHLDLRYQLRLLEHLKQCCHEGTTVVMALHDLRQARHWCDHLILLVQGRVLAEGTPEQTLAPEVLQQAFGVPPEALD